MMKKKIYSLSGIAMRDVSFKRPVQLADSFFATALIFFLMFSVHLFAKDDPASSEKVNATQEAVNLANNAIPSSLETVKGNEREKEAKPVEGNLPRKPMATGSEGVKLSDASTNAVGSKQAEKPSVKAEKIDKTSAQKARANRKGAVAQVNPSVMVADAADVLSGQNKNRDKEEEDIAKVLPEKCVKPKGKFPWNFENTDLLSLVNQISQLTCTNWIIAEDVKPKKKISIIGRTPITVDEALKVFKSAMEANELATVRVGNYEKIVKRTDASKQPLSVYDGENSIPRDENMVTGIIGVRSKDESRMIKNLVSRAGSVEELGESILIINESGANINRIMDILKVVHSSGPDARIFDVELQYARASDVQKTLNELFGAGSDRRGGLQDRGAARGGKAEEAGPLYKLVIYEPTNRLFIVTTESAYRQMTKVIEKLDVSPTEGSSQGEIHVHRLSHASAKELTATLTSLSQGRNQQRDQRPRVRMPDQELGGELFEGEVKITADETTNSLVIVASRRDYKSLAKVIDRLDQRRKQVLLEAVIMEMEVSDDTNFGINAYGALPGFNDGLIIGSNPAGKDLAGNIIKSTLEKGQGAGFASLLGVIGVAGPNANIPGLPGFPSFGAVLNAVATNSKSNVLATPSMMTLDNKKAEFSSGKRVPYLKGTAGLGTAAIGTLQQVEMQDVELKFNVTPHVNAQNEIRMEIEQEDNQLGLPRILLNQETPEILKKSARTEVVAKDQQSVVIGGLINERDVKAENKVPLLGDIPILGHLFKNTKWEKRRYRLLLVITPTIIEKDADYLKVYNRRMNEMREFSELIYGKRALIYDPSIDYTKKIGPAARAIRHLEGEMMKTENGGPGIPGEQVIVPEESKPEEDEEDSIDIDEEGLDVGSDTNGGSPVNPPAQPLPPQPIPQPPPIEMPPVPQGGFSFDMDEL